MGWGVTLPGRDTLALLAAGYLAVTRADEHHRDRAEKGDLSPAVTPTTATTATTATATS
jgi:hypothetical protein